VEIEVASKATNIQITVRTVSPTSAPSATSTGRVFQYMEITPKNLNNTQIRTARIEFRVNTTWLFANSFEKEDVILEQYENATGWQRLVTRVISENVTEVLYSAVTPGFSIFAITAEKSAIQTMADTTTVPANNETQPAENPQQEDIAGTTAYAQGTPDNEFNTLFLVPIFGIIIFFIFLAYRKVKSRYKNTVV
jgi:PGF-pre-PGF domain-containing protein